MATTFNYLTGAAKDRVLYNTSEGSPGYCVVSATLNISASEPFVSFRGYVGARQYVLITQLGPSDFKIELQNIFNDNYSAGVNPNQNNEFSLSNARIVIINVGLPVTGLPFSSNTGIITYIDPMSVDALYVRFVEGASVVAPPDNSKLHVTITLEKNRAVQS